MPPTAVDDSYTVAIGETLIVPAPGILGNDKVPITAVGGDPDWRTDRRSCNAQCQWLIQLYVLLRLFGAGQLYISGQQRIVIEHGTVVITILDPNGPPVAVDDAYELNVDETLTIPAPGVLG